MNYYIITGEKSGDLHASKLMKELKDLDTEAEFRCWGGDLMQAEGGHIVKHIKDLAFMGFVEVLRNMRFIRSNLLFCKKDIIEHQPDVLILVDYPGFNLRIAKFSKTLGLRVIYYISPKIWAWKEQRIKKIKKYVDRMICILPFELEFYAKHNLVVNYVGHPSIDEIYVMDKMGKHKFFKDNNLVDKPIIALLPGSRKQEVQKMLGEMVKIVNHFQDFQFVIAATKNVDKEIYDSMMTAHVSIVFDQTLNLLKYSEAAIIASGTASLEAALLNIPQVVCYKANPINIFMGRLFIKVKYISLVNLILNRKVVNELIQHKMNYQFLAKELSLILNDSAHKERILTAYKELKFRLGEAGASRRAAEIVLKSK